MESCPLTSKEITVTVTEKMLPFSKKEWLADGGKAVDLIYLFTVSI